MPFTTAGYFLILTSIYPCSHFLIALLDFLDFSVNHVNSLTILSCILLFEYLQVLSILYLIDIAKKCSNYCTIAFIPLASKVMLKILQGRLQQYVNRELPDATDGFRKGRGTRNQIANGCWIIEKAQEFRKSSDFCFIDYAKAFDCVDHNKLPLEAQATSALCSTSVGCNPHPESQTQDLLLVIRWRKRPRRGQQDSILASSLKESSLKVLKTAPLTSTGWS